MPVTGMAHTGVCVPDVDAAVAWYERVLGMKVLSPPYLMSGPEIELDMGEMVPGVSLKAAIMGFDHSDHVLEVIEYPEASSGGGRRRLLTDPGFSHFGLVCDDLDGTRGQLEAGGVHFLTGGSARIAGLRTAWFEDPYGTVFILMEKGDPGRAYWRQSTAGS